MTRGVRKKDHNSETELLPEPKEGNMMYVEQIINGPPSEKKIKRNPRRNKVGIPLESNLNRYNVLRYIKEQPGTHYSQIKRALGLSPGVLSYHLRKLEDNTLIKSYKDEYYTRYKANGEKSHLLQISTRQKEIYAIISKRSGISTSRLADILEKRTQTITYHTRILVRKGIVFFKREGHEMLWYAVKRAK